MLLTLVSSTLLAQSSYATDEASIALPRCMDDLITIRYDPPPPPARGLQEWPHLPLNKMLSPCFRHA